MNSKIRNATKVTNSEGVKFASKLELYLYTLLKENKIEFEFQKTILLQEGFRYLGEKIRPITIIVDFCLPEYDYIVDSKGWQLADNKMKIKMLKKVLWDDGKQTKIKLLSTQKECREFVSSLIGKV